MQSVQPTAKKVLQLGSNQTIALQALEEHLSQTVVTAPSDEPGIRLDDALAVVAQLMTCEPKHKKQRAKEAITGLVDKGILNKEDEWLTIPHPAPLS